MSIMGIYCEINLHSPSNAILLGKAGSVVSGIIKYAVDVETEFTKITVSLKGLGTICLEENVGRRRITYTKSETYIDIDDVIYNEIKRNKTLIGAYEVPFRFELPCNVPPSVTYKNSIENYDAKCRIRYYVRIKFNQRGMWNFTKRFKKDITVVSGIIPRLSTTPIIYGGQKKLIQPFTLNSSLVNIKATIVNSIHKCGDRIKIYYELTNNTNLTIKAVETKLVEVHKFYIKPDKPAATGYEDVPGTESKTSTVKSGQKQEMLVEIDIPLVKESAEFSNIYAREYCVFIVSHLPLPYINYVFQIPVQIGHNFTEHVTEETENESCSTEYGNPPSYWESMNEYKADKIELYEIDNINSSNSSK